MYTLCTTAKKTTFAAVILAHALFGGMAAYADGLQPIMGAIGETKPILDMRLRYEMVDQEPFARDANAVTLRTRAGFETGKAWDTSLLVESEWVMPLTAKYNSTINRQTTFPTVADPKVIELNRLQFTNSSIPATVITFGRQRINLDDQRFVGNVGWRQNEQTFDALRIVNKTITDFTMDGTYFRQVNRIFGNKSPQGSFSGDNYLLNTAYQFPLGKLTAFTYLVQFDDVGVPRTDSSQTYGVRFAGDKQFSKIKLVYAGSLATQKDYSNNPLNYSDNYYLAEVTGFYRQYSAGAGYEVLEGNGVKGFTTPLATLHKFQGWADKFLTTPPNGIKDLYFNVGYLVKGVGPFDTVSAAAIYHRYNAQHISRHYGDETNLQLQAKWQRFNFTFKYAYYDADRLATNTNKLWLQVDFVL